MNIIVVGTGSMGEAIAYAFIKLGYNVFAVDKNRDSLNHAITFLKKQGMYFSDYTDNLEKFSELKVDLVFSAAPYSENYSIAYNCLALKRRYCDLGGNYHISSHIRDYYNKISDRMPCFTDLGLAPGFVSILLEHAATQIELENSHIFVTVGGLPINPKNTLKYNRVFSIDGLYNEYTGKCEIIKDNKIESINALDGLARIDWYDKIDADVFCDTYEPMESFYTSGGLGDLSSLQKRKVSECSYKTLRYEGHCNYIKFLLYECKLDKKAFCAALEHACPPTNADKVLVDIWVLSNKKRWIRRFRVDADDKFTAMQKMTAFPAVSVAAIMTTGEMDKFLSLDYSDIPLDKFFSILDKIGGIDTKLFK